MKRLNDHGKAIARAMSEDELKANVLDLAALNGYRRIHFRPARTERGWRTAYEGDDGYPDITLAGGIHIIVAELKNQRRKIEPEQQAWLEAFRDSGALAFLWRPADWVASEIENILGDNKPIRRRRR